MARDLGDPAFLHQHVVDAYGAQEADETTKPIRVAFGLIGLYLHVERGFSGRQVQRAHMRLAQDRRVLPVFELTNDRGTMTAADVMETAEGPDRDAAIDAWCQSVWRACDGNRDIIVPLLGDAAIIRVPG